MTYTAKAVANYFIERSIASGESLSPMKLIKLVYLAHGWHLAFKNAPLIDEAVQAWKYGPVIVSLYHALKEYGNGAITELTRDFNFDGSTFCTSVPSINREDAFTVSLLDKVWSTYGKNSALQLSTATHQPNTPWWQTWHNNGGSDKKGAIIPNDTIASHFSAKLNDSAEATGI